MDYFSFANPCYATADKAFIDVDLVLIEGGESIPYTCSASDPISANLFADVKKAGGIAVYSAPVLSLADSAAALIAGGLAVTSTATPALDGTYACDQATQQRIMAETISLLQNGTFADGTSSIAWPDTAGSLHTFSIDQFKQFNTKIAGFVSGCIAVMTANAGTLPVATATID